MNTSEMSREELVDELDMLRDVVEIRGADSIENAALKDIWIAGEPVGILLDSVRKRVDGNSNAISDLANEDVSKGIDPEIRGKFIPLHEMAIDLRDGRMDRIPDQKARRAAELFHRMVLRMCDEPQPGVERSLGRVKITSSSAQQILVEACDDLDSAQPQQVKRAFMEAQRLTKTEDCDCDSIEVCKHGMVQFRSGWNNKLVAAEEQLADYLRGVKDAVESFDEDAVGGRARSDQHESQGDQPPSRTDGQTTDHDRVDDVDESVFDATPARADGGQTE
jgi:hypothetical protein